MIGSVIHGLKNRRCIPLLPLFKLVKDVQSLETCIFIRIINKDYVAYIANASTNPLVSPSFWMCISLPREVSEKIACHIYIFSNNQFVHSDLCYTGNENKVGA